MPRESSDGVPVMISIFLKEMITAVTSTDEVSPDLITRLGPVLRFDWILDQTWSCDLMTRLGPVI